MVAISTTTTTNIHYASNGAQYSSSTSSSSSSTSTKCNGIDDTNYCNGALTPGFVKRRHYNNNKTGDNNRNNNNISNNNCGTDVYSGYRKLCEIRMRRLERYKKARSFCSLEDENNNNNNSNNNYLDNKVDGNKGCCHNSNCRDESRFKPFFHHVSQFDNFGSVNPCLCCSIKRDDGGSDLCYERGGGEEQQPRQGLKASTSCSQLNQNDFCQWRDNNNKLKNKKNKIQPAYSYAELRNRRSPVGEAVDDYRRLSSTTNRYHVNIRPASESDSIFIDLEESLSDEMLPTLLGRSEPPNCLASANGDEWRRYSSDDGTTKAQRRDSATSRKAFTSPPPLNCQFEILREKMISMMENDVQLLRKLLTLGDTIQALRGTATATGAATASAKQLRRWPQNGGSVSSEDDDRKTVVDEEEEENELDHRVEYFARPLNIRHLIKDEQPKEAEAALENRSEEDRFGMDAAPYSESKSDNSTPGVELSAAITRLYVDAAVGGAGCDIVSLDVDNRPDDDDDDDDVALEPNVQYFSRKNSVLRIPIPPRASKRRNGVGSTQPSASTAKKITTKLRYAPPPNHGSTHSSSSSTSLASSSSTTIAHARHHLSSVGAADQHNILEEEEADDDNVVEEEDDSGNSSASITPPLAQCSPKASGDSGSAPSLPPTVSPARLLSEADSGAGSSRYSTVSSATTSSSLDALSSAAVTTVKVAAAAHSTTVYSSMNGDGEEARMTIVEPSR